MEGVLLLSALRMRISDEEMEEERFCFYSKCKLFSPTNKNSQVGEGYSLIWAI